MANTRDCELRSSHRTNTAKQDSSMFTIKHNHRLNTNMLTVKMLTPGAPAVMSACYFCPSWQQSLILFSGSSGTEQTACRRTDRLSGLTSREVDFMVREADWHSDRSTYPLRCLVSAQHSPTVFNSPFTAFCTHHRFVRLRSWVQLSANTTVY